MKTISIFNQKGGVGKTTSSINIAAVLSKKGYKTLLIDSDQQSNCTSTLKITDNTSNNLCDVLRYADYDINKSIRPTEYHNLYILPSSNELKNVPIEICSNPSINAQYRLAKQLRKIEDDFDFCIIDCAPLETVITANVLLASNEVMIPITLEEYSLDGVNQLLKTAKHYKDEFMVNLKIRGVFITKFDRRIKDQIDGERELRKKYAKAFIPYVIRTDQVVNKSVKNKIPTVFFNPNCKASKDYENLVEGVLI